MPGISARATDSANVEIRNAGGSKVYIRVSGWEVAQFETCRGLVEDEVVTGPLAPGEVFRTDLTHLIDRPEVPITVSVYLQPCGEAGCRSNPVAVLFIPRSTMEPAAS